MGVCYITVSAINVTAGKTYRVAIDAPPRGEIIRAQFIQRAPGTSTFSFTFYNSAKSCPPGDPANPPNTAGDATVAPATEYAGQIGPTRTVATAGDRWLGPDGSDGGWTSLGSYSNNDAGHSDAKSKLYLKFTAGGTGIFDIYITIKTERG